MRCPSCKTSDVARAQVVWEQNTHIGSAKSAGVGIGTGGVGIGGAKTNSKTNSLAAAGLAPPKAKRGNWEAQGVVLVLISIVVLPLFVIGGPLGIWIFLKGRQHRRDHKVALESWTRTWYCLRCGTKADQSAFEERDAASEAAAT